MVGKIIGEGADRAPDRGRGIAFQRLLEFDAIRLPFEEEVHQLLVVEMHEAKVPSSTDVEPVGAKEARVGKSVAGEKPFSAPGCGGIIAAVLWDGTGEAESMDENRDDVVIVGAARTAVGAFCGAFADTPAAALGAVAIAAALARAGIAAADVDEVVMGQVLTAAQGQNPARQAAMRAGVPQEKTAYQINQLCGSGLRAVALGMQALRCGDAAIVVAGGQENMSCAPHAATLRAGRRLGDATLTDTMISDGLWCAFNGYHMGNTAENIARQWSLSREDLDAFAAESQQKAEAARAAGRFEAEIAPVVLKTRRGETTVSVDESPRSGVTAAALATLKPAFAKDGVVTAGNASSLNDGAAVLVLTTAREAAARGLRPLARIASWATAGVDPALMGTGPIQASRQALRNAGWSVGDLDLVEANEAFAAQALAVNREMGWDPARVNVNGGAIAIGHPIGASGARVLVTLLSEMARRSARKGLATLCIGGGMGIALCVERV